jgi:hypothetical protein
MRKLILVALVSCAFAVPAFADPHGGGHGNGGMSHGNAGMNHGGAVSAEAHLARSQNGGGIGKDVSAVARDKSRIGAHDRSHHGKSYAHGNAYGHSAFDHSRKRDNHRNRDTHGDDVSTEAHLAKSQHDGGIGEDVKAVAHDKTPKK